MIYLQITSLQALAGCLNYYHIQIIKVITRKYQWTKTPPPPKKTTKTDPWKANHCFSATIITIYSCEIESGVYFSTSIMCLIIHLCTLCIVQIYSTAFIIQGTKIDTECCVFQFKNLVHFVAQTNLTMRKHVYSGGPQWCAIDQHRQKEYHSLISYVLFRV